MQITHRFNSKVTLISGNKKVRERHLALENIIGDDVARPPLKEKNTLLLVRNDSQGIP
ncbi:hypothetical protein [Janthinobacterium sp. 61]|uniref:hypothetical protein n=1 Tax=Janthinobacterium sp. 61 TaxID=2035209 RepID=UPI0015D5EDD0|nr:hypothetical protein [Janthinobacterium sp. 61]